MPKNLGSKSILTDLPGVALATVPVLACVGAGACVGAAACVGAGACVGAAACVGGGACVGGAGVGAGAPHPAKTNNTTRTNPANGIHRLDIFILLLPIMGTCLLIGYVCLMYESRFHLLRK